MTRRELFEIMTRYTKKTALIAGAASGVAALASGRRPASGRPRGYPASRTGAAGAIGIPVGERPVRVVAGTALQGIIRPPGSLPEKAFLASCIRCTHCQDACNIGAIQHFTESDGRHYRTPYIEPALKGCTLCMDCTRACPTPAIRGLERKDRFEVRMATVELDPDLCLSHRARKARDAQAMLAQLGRDFTELDGEPQRRGPCGECFMFCPLRNRAIKLAPGAFLAPEVFPEHCAGCGMCEEICRVMVRGEPAIRVVPLRSKVGGGRSRA